MINELYELSMALENLGLLQSITHPDVNSVGKSSCVLFELSDSGVPLGLRYLQKDRTATLWKHSKGNHNSFPAIKFKKPILTASESEKLNDKLWEEAKHTDRIAMLSELNCTAINPDCNDVMISDWTLAQLQPVLGSNISELESLETLISVFPRKGEATAFLMEAAALLLQEAKLCQQEEELNTIRKLLVGVYNEKNDRYESGVMTYYDMYDLNRYEVAVVSVAARRALITLLNGCSRLDISNMSAESQLTGAAVANICKKYPNPNLPLLGSSYLYTRKFDTLCLTRYGMTGAEAFAAGEEEVASINDALAFLTDASRKGQTWCAMADASSKDPNLLLAYLPDDPQNEGLLARILGAPSDYEDEEEYREAAETRFEALCQQVLGGIEHVMRKNSQSRVNLILIKKIDKGNRQITFKTSFTAERMRRNLLEWNEAAENHPPVSLRIYENDNPKLVPLVCPGPYEICRLLKTSYHRSGDVKPMNQSDATLREIYSLYIPSNDSVRTDALLDRFIETAVRKSRLLLGDAGFVMTLSGYFPRAKRTLAEQAANVRFAAVHPALSQGNKKGALYA